jgi:hypothetical protein
MSSGVEGAGLAARADLGPRMARVVTYFVVTFALFLLPFALTGLDFLLAPAPYVVHPDALPASGSSLQRFDDGSEVNVLVRSSSEAAQAAVEDILRKTPTRSFSQTNGKVVMARYYNAISGRACAWLRIDGVAVGVEAPDRATVDRRLASLAVVTKAGGDPLFELLDEHIGTALIGIGIYTLFIASFMLKAASWAARIDPAPETPALSSDALGARLRELEKLGLPWHVEQRRPGVYRVEWTYLDARRVHAQGAGRRKETDILTLRVDESRRRVSVVETTRSLSAGAGFTGLFASVSFWRGLSFFAYETGTAVGLGFRDGCWRLVEAYRYRFTPDEMRNPLVEAIVDSGWTYAPSLTLIRWLD